MHPMPTNRSPKRWQHPWVPWVREHTTFKQIWYEPNGTQSNMAVEFMVIFNFEWPPPQGQVHLDMIFSSDVQPINIQFSCILMKCSKSVLIFFFKIYCSTLSSYVNSLHGKLKKGLVLWETTVQSKSCRDHFLGLCSYELFCENTKDTELLSPCI